MGACVMVDAVLVNPQHVAGCLISVAPPGIAAFGFVAATLELTGQRRPQPG
jgi:hypothetical protein